MNRYRANSSAWGMRRASDSADLWSKITNFLRRQPVLVVGATLVGGAFLGLWIKNATGASYPSVYRGDNQRWARPHEIPHRMPSARLGATEDQMGELATPSRQALEAGTAGATGAAYDLDPRSITAG